MEVNFRFRISSNIEFWLVQSLQPKGFACTLSFRYIEQFECACVRSPTARINRQPPTT